MSLDDKPAPPKPLTSARKKIKRVLSGLLVSIALLAVLTAVMLSARPRWHTITGNAKPGEWVGSLECPENWQSEHEPTMPDFHGFKTLTMRRKPLNGLPAWWSKYILHQPEYGNRTELRLFIMPEPRFAIVGMPPAPRMTHAEQLSHAADTLDNFELGYKVARTSSLKPLLQRVAHPLGPAIAVFMDGIRPFNSGTGQPGSARRFLYDQLVITPTEAGDFTGIVMVSYFTEPSEDAMLRPTIERMTRSIRLVKK